MKHIIIIRNFSAISFLMLLVSISTIAAPVVRKAADTNSFALFNSITQFSQDLGGANNGVGGSYITGRRNVNWDDVPDNIASGAFPGNYYNTTSPRGMVLSTACTNDGFKVSGDGENGTTLTFSEYNAAYAASFKILSFPRVFSANNTGCNVIDVYFYIPGTNIPATVKGFSVVFTDVDLPTSGIICYGVNGAQLAPFQAANISSSGYSFLGVSFNNGERIAHVRIFSGNVKLGTTDTTGGIGADDAVVMDDMTFGEPRAIGFHSSDFDGDGTSDHAVFRPADGTWYAFNSGSNTFQAVQFGANGDVPVDGDFDGDGLNDFTVYRPSTGVWYSLRTSNNQAKINQFGLNGDKPVTGDYDKDGKTDIAVWRPSDGNYYWINSSNGEAKAAHWGASGDIPVGSR